MYYRFSNSNLFLTLHHDSKCTVTENILILLQHKIIVTPRMVTVATHDMDSMNTEAFHCMSLVAENFSKPAAITRYQIISDPSSLVFNSNMYRPRNFYSPSSIRILLFSTICHLFCSNLKFFYLFTDNCFVFSIICPLLCR